MIACFPVQVLLYVRGEVNKEEYEEKKRVITGHN